MRHNQYYKFIWKVWYFTWQWNVVLCFHKRQSNLLSYKYKRQMLMMLFNTWKISSNIFMGVLGLCFKCIPINILIKKKMGKKELTFVCCTNKTWMRSRLVCIIIWVVLLFEQRIISPYVYIEPYKDSFHYTLKCIKVQSIFNGDFTLHR